MNYKVYTDRNIKRDFEKNIKHQCIKSGLKIESVPRGIITVNQKTTGYGVCSADGKFIKSSRHVEHNRWHYQLTTKDIKTPIPYFDYEVVYMGPLINFFGHVLLDVLSRGYAFLGTKDKNMKYVFINDQSYDKPADFFYEFFRLLGMDKKNIIILGTSAQFKNVFIPEQGFCIAAYASKEYMSAIGQIKKNAARTESFEKIYVSRSALKSQKTFGEEKIEKIFEKNGYKIIHPETLPLAQQISLIGNCKSLAGVAGTALHLAVFMKPGGEVIQIKRDGKKGCNSDVQHLICMAAGLDFTLISGSIEKHKTNHSTTIPQIIGITEHMRNFFNARGFKYAMSDLDFNSAAWLQYETALANFKNTKNVKQTFVQKAKVRFVKYLSIFVPGRLNRRYFRDWLSEILKIHS